MSQRIMSKAASRTVTLQELVSAVAGGVAASATTEAPAVAGAPSVTRPRSLRSTADDDAPDVIVQSPAQGFVERNAPLVVGVTYWFDPPPRPSHQTVVLEIEGQKCDGDERFHHEECLDDVIAGSGPVAVTAKVSDVAPGDWQLQAQFRTRPANSGVDRIDHMLLPAHRAAWSWRRWRLADSAPAAVKTRLAPLVPAPAVLLGSWLALVLLGFAAGLVMQLLLADRFGLSVASTVFVSSLAAAIGALVAKVWYRVQNRCQRSRQGWCLQGFIAGVVISAPVLLWLFDVAPGAYLDASAAALMLGAAIGRIGCFFTGCCAGRATASRWGIWSSNRTVGARRIPTQLIESAFALLVSAVSLSVLLSFGVQHGGILVVALATYTLGRQVLLPLREEPRQSRLGAWLIAPICAVALVAGLAAIVIS